MDAGRNRRTRWTSKLTRARGGNQLIGASSITRVALLLLSVLCGAVAVLGCEQTGKEPIFATEGGAIDGFDPVAYFSERRALRGDTEVWLDWRGARWYFADAGNRALLLEDPESYAPAFGGYCAYGVASGYAVKSDPEAWTIWRDRLYLNYDLETREEWLLDRDALITKGRQSWPGVLD